jgi:hypothetical protein
MKVLYSIITIIICVILVDCSERKPVIEEGQTKIELIDSVFHINYKRSMGKSIQHRFVFKNSGENPLVINRPEPSCGCIDILSYTKRPIKPGENGYIDIIINSDKLKPGFFNKIIGVHSNAENYVECKVVGKIE